MERVLPLPPAFGRFARMGGVLDFALFRDASGSEEEVLAALPAVLAPYRCDPARLRGLGRRHISEAVFFGEDYDPQRGLLLKSGEWSTVEGERLSDPPLVGLGHHRITSGGRGIPRGPGQFAFAFRDPPYGLHAAASPVEIQAVFDEIRDVILPPGQGCTILDWSHERLPEVSDYFAAGAEWWGVFLFSIAVPSIRRLSIIAGSATD